MCGQGKLSDEVLAAALLTFYESKSAMPEGISKSAMTAWANKQAYGLRKCCQKFRKLAWQAESSYSPKIADGKERIRQAALTTKSVPAPCPDPQAAEFLEQADESFDWDRLEGLIAGAQAEKVPKIEPGEKSRPLKLPNKVAASNLVATSMQRLISGCSGSCCHGWFGRP